jgi:NitT/TauT family transport system ATP-binding protein
VLEGVSRSFQRGHERVRALAPIDLRVAAGEFVAVIGPSGCGKSTLLRLVGGLLAPDEGAVRVLGRPAVEARRAKQFGLVPQSPALLPWRTAEANIGLLRQVNRRHDRGPAPDVGRLVDLVGLRGFERALPAELSGGMQQRVALARAFALGAPVLLMDEPFAALDEITREEMRFLLARTWAGTSDEATGAARTVLFVTHSIEEAVILADRVVVLGARPGRVIADEAIALGRPRRPALEDSEAYHEHVRRVRAALRRASPGGANAPRPAT